MTDIKQIDLSTLERGDTVVFRDGKTAIVNQAILAEPDRVNIALRLKDLISQLCETYFLNGRYAHGGTTKYDIVQIIKTPRRWTDDDMKAAADGAILQNYKQGYQDFDKWLEQYKQVKNAKSMLK